MVADDVRGCSCVLEVGAGTGMVTVQLASVAHELTATDRSPEMLAILRGRLADAGHAGVQVRQADVLALDFPAASFDAVVAANLLHLLPDPAAALAELRRVLRPGGVLCAPTFGHGQHLLAHAASRLLAGVGFPVVTRFRSDTLRSTIEAASFVVVREAVVPGILPLLHVTARRGDGGTPGGAPANAA